MSWPLAGRVRTDLPALDLGDAYLFAWQVSWDGYAIVHQPADLLDANTFWPSTDSLAFLDSLLGYAPAGLIGRGTTAAVVRYDLLFLFAYALAFVAAYLLAREVGLGPWGATVAGMAFAYAPWRLAQNNHLHVLSSGGVPLSLFLLLRGYRRKRPGLVLAGWAGATWQVSLGFTLGVPLAYLLAVLALVWGVRWLGSGRPRLEPVLLRATAAGVLLLVGFALWQGIPYLRVAREHPEARRTVREVEFYSPPAYGLIVAPEADHLWGALTEPIRKRLISPGEQSLFPGGLVLVLAILGGTSSVLSRRTRLGLGIGVIVCILLSLGLSTRLSSALYGPLYRFAPGWNGLRTPGRLIAFASLGLGLLAGAGTERILEGVPGWWGRRGRRPRTVRVKVLAGTVLAGAMLAEGAGVLPLTRVPPVPEAQAVAAQPLLQLPIDDISDRLYTFWSIQGFPEMVNGAAVFPVRSLYEIASAVKSFPDEASVSFLRSLGVRSVLVHVGLIAGTPWEDAATKPIEGLGVTREGVGDVVVYRL